MILGVCPPDVSDESNLHSVSSRSGGKKNRILWSLPLCLSHADCSTREQNSYHHSCYFSSPVKQDWTWPWRSVIQSSWSCEQTTLAKPELRFRKWPGATANFCVLYHLLKVKIVAYGLMAQVKTSKSIFSKRVFFIKCVFPDQGWRLMQGVWELG